MAFKEVQTGSNIKQYWPKKAAERKKGDSIEGVYQSKMERPGFAGGTDVLYLLETKDGIAAVNSNASIARKMEQVPEGTRVRIIFNGKMTNPKSGRQYNDFSVLMDDGKDGNEDDLNLENLNF